MPQEFKVIYEIFNKKQHKDEYQLIASFEKKVNEATSAGWKVANCSFWINPRMLRIYQAFLVRD